MAREKSKQYTTRIPIADGYEVLVDSNNYSVAYNTGRFNKDGDVVFDYISFHSTLDKAILGVVKEMGRRRIRSEKTMELEEAISILVRTNNYVASLVKNAFEGVVV